uniref:Uncharacterized protein n=1 Tax=Panagrolaimus sp. PS1159 TaxID=55785 RepID=A0AC35GL74_9BILA
MAPVLAYMNSHWPPSAYLTVVCLGIINLSISYKYLVETKGINLDHVHVEDETREVHVEEEVKMLPQSTKA